MKTFTTSSFVILLICITSCVFAQDEIYNEKPKKELVMDTVKMNIPIVSSIDSNITDSISSKMEEEGEYEYYYTEDDFYEENYGVKNDDQIIYTQDEAIEDPREKRDNEGLRVVVEIFFNVLMVFALGH